MYPGLIEFRLPMVTCYLLMDEDGCVLIDTGLVGLPRRLFRALRRSGRDVSDVRAILLTHAHLDHVGGLHAIQRATGAAVYAHPAEQLHLEGRYPYRGLARVCGGLEAVGRTLVRYRPGTIDHPLTDGQVLPFWGGLRVVHLPGHTEGHCGYYSLRNDVLFCGDLFVSSWWGTCRPPAVFNSCPHLLEASYQRVMALNPGGLLPNHRDRADARAVRRRYDRAGLADR